ncbi:MAG: hypothetical protein KDA37_14045, partial [Planctomycetales bacterium]|nr:hypothetical protein [Planctomycetales bacterium]
MSFHRCSLTLLASVAALLPQQLFAQAAHSDAIFKYVDAQIELLPSPGQEYSSQRVWTGEWDVGGFFAQDTNQPGWASEAVGGQGIGPGDIVAYNVLDNLYYWNEGVFASPDPQVHVRVQNNGSSDTLVDHASGAQPGSVAAPFVNTIGQADGIGDFHKHVRYKLEHDSGATPSFGAYGLSLSLSTNASGVADSEPLFLIFNFGLSQQDFAAAANAYAELFTPSLPGDFNGDGSVDAADYTV